MAAKEKWSDEKPASQEMTSSGKRVWRATKAYQVTDAADEADALGQCPLQMGSDHPVYGNELKVNSIDPERSGPRGFYTVRFGFSSDAPDTGGTVNTKARLRWSHDAVIEEVDRDFDGRPITNSVGDPPVNHPTRDYFDLVLTYTRWEPFFDVRRSLQILNAICSDNFVIEFGTGSFNGGSGSFNGGSLGNNLGNAGNGPLGLMGGEAKCTAYAPVGENEEGQALVQVYYEFRLRERIQISDTTWASGFDWRFLDQGSRGLYDATLEGDLKLLPLYNSDGEEITEPVRLNGFGVPLQSDIKVGRRMTSAVSLPRPPAGAELDLRYAGSDPKAVFLIFKRHKRTPFKGLLPIFK